MSNILKKSDKSNYLDGVAGFAHEWVETAEGIYYFNREAIRDECECGCEECGGFPLDQLGDDEILLSPGAIYQLGKEVMNG